MKKIPTVPKYIKNKDLGEHWCKCGKKIFLPNITLKDDDFSKIFNCYLFIVDCNKKRGYLEEFSGPIEEFTKKYHFISFKK